MAVSQDNEDLTRVGPGTVMGDLMRQYWIPFAKSSELEADGAPMRTMLLGEKLIAFRDSSGRVGVMDHRCPHRCASLFLGRNEEDGIRCVYHGWKFDVDGNCVDMPSVPAHQDFKDKVHAKAYRATERAGLVWVYMGTRAEAPPLPDIEVTLLPESEVDLIFMQRECNWLQTAEGDIDTAHAAFLHDGHVTAEELGEDHPYYPVLKNRAPEYKVVDTPFGTSYGAFRDTGDGRFYWRVANFAFPFWTQEPAGAFPYHVHARALVPLDDMHTMVIIVTWKGAHAHRFGMASHPKKDGGFVPVRRDIHYLPNTSDWLGRWRVAENPSNDWGLNREWMASNLYYSGMDNVFLQDQAVTESMGGITDHSLEHLASSDQMIARTRRRLLRAARALREQNALPPGVEDPAIYRLARSGHFFSDAGTDWQDAVRAEMEAAQWPASQMRAAE